MPQPTQKSIKHFWKKKKNSHCNSLRWSNQFVMLYRKLHEVKSSDGDQTDLIVNVCHIICLLNRLLQQGISLSQHVLTYCAIIVTRCSEFLAMPWWQDSSHLATIRYKSMKRLLCKQSLSPIRMKLKVRAVQEIHKGMNRNGMYLIWTFCVTV